MTSPAGVILPNEECSHLDNVLLGEDGHLRVLPAQTLLAIPAEELRQWAHWHAIYQFPTEELIAWLKTLIGDVSAIEIGAGNGAIARALNITATDSYVQLRPDMRLAYKSMGQPIVQPPPDVRQMDAHDAVMFFGPHTVIAAWVTRKFLPGIEVEGRAQAFIYGVDEDALLRRVHRYVVIGNEAVHGQKRIMDLPHETYSFPWIVSRAQRPELNRIWVWKGGRR